jgi:hypothetical protein
LYRKQFLLAKKKIDISGLKEKQKVFNYHLYLGADSEYNYLKNKTKEIHLLGNLYDWENPHYSNKQIIELIFRYDDINVIIEKSNNYCGEFVFIIKLDNDLFIFNDATSQKEIYYDDTFNNFGTQPKLLNLTIDLVDHVDPSAIEYYQSEIFKKKYLFVGNTTHKKNILHLLPNHIITINTKSVKRFFPSQKLDKQPLISVANKCAEMLQGYISAIYRRNKIKMAITGGYDSRVLFLASLNVDCKYFVLKHKNMSDSHHDIVVPKYLTGLFHKNLNIEEREVLNVDDKNYINDVDFPRFISKSNKNNDHTFINGNISEIARNYYGYYKNATAKDLCFLTGNASMKFVIKLYDSWLTNKNIFFENGYHYLDMFYWEEKMGNWSKMKTERNALSQNVVSPFNSRNLLTHMLSTNRSDRDSHFNKLYDLIISVLSKENKKVLKTPINPCPKQTIIKFMKRIKIYNLYRYIGVKSKLLNV